ncbi:MAG: hypothetical protein IJY21_00615 [Clostridia bacterium]|nr:hypothetical protein [Clostridia bacterium]
MKDSTQNRKKKFLALFLSAMMAVSVASLAACHDGGNTSSESSSEETETETTVTDKGPIKNAGFEVFDTNDGLNVIGMTVSNWSRSLYSDGSVSAPSSKADSGIIDTEESAWNDLTGSYYVENGDAADIAAADKLIEALSESDAINAWDNFTTRDKLKYYEVWKDNNEDGKISEDFDKYENFNSGSLALVDVPDTANPGTHHSETDKAAEGFSDHNILMIHNKNPETDEGEKVVQSIGSAQKYTSSSTVTVQAGAAAEISVWVKTQDLMCSSSDGTAQEAVDKGAYISLAQTVGGTSMPVYEVKNINTEYMGLETTNGWKQYTFFVKGSSYASTTLTLTLGLGQGTSNSRSELVNGYAFFDDITCNIFSQESYDAKLAAVNTGSNVVNATKFEDPKALKTIDVSKEFNSNSYANAETLGFVAGQGFDVFPIDFYGQFSDADGVLSNINAYATKSEKGYTSMTGNNTMPTLEGGRNGNADIISVFDNVAAIGSYTPDANDTYGADKKKFADGIYSKYLQDVEYPGANNKVLLMLSARGVAYTAKSDYTFSFNSDVEYMAVSFFVRTSDMDGFTGAGITLIDGKNKTSFANIDTTDITPVNIGLEDTEDYKEDIYEGWQQCIFFVKNDSGDENASFKLQFNFGPTTIDETSSINSFQPGFAAFTNFQTLVMSEEEYASATAGTYAKLVTVTGETDVTAAGNSGFDTAGNKSSTHADIKDGIALAQNYKGVYSNSDYVTDKFNENTAINAYLNAGLLNRTYFTGAKGEESYYTTTDAPAWMAGVTKIAQTNNASVDTSDASAVWSAAFGNATQPLFIWNDGVDTTNSYGFIGSSTSIAADTTTAISMRVKVGSTDANAAAPTAHIYLIDTSDDTRANTLSIGANVTYWYDKKGDVYTGDPTERSSEKAFILQDNGLYIANTAWSGYDAATMEGKYFANLNAYTETDANGNKLIAANGGVHSYVAAADYVKVNGEKRAIAFYCKDGAYYADKACSLPVADFSTTGVTTRTDKASSKALYAEVAATDDWVTVTFYIKTGSTAKNYRLEVWSGERTGNPNAAGTYVMFDGNPSAATNAETYYNNLLNLYKDDESIEQYKSVFSYFDTDKFLRYNKDLDVDEIGNLYEENYDVTAQEEAVFYLYAGAKTENQSFLVNYATQDQVVTAAESDKDDTTTDDGDDTTATGEGTDPFLLASSIAIAVVLLFTIASIIFRKLWKKARKSIVSKKRAPKKSKSKTVKTATVKAEEPKEEIDEDSPYND